MTLLPWHRQAAEQLSERAAAGRLPHGLLLTAPPGWGEQRLANWLALHLLGLAEDRVAEELAHPDLRWVKPDGAVIKIDEVRGLVAFAVGTPQSSPRKVAVVADADCLNRNAANALLKTLEEPPPETHLVLTSCHPGRLLPTVRSRCQVLKLKPDTRLARRWLEENLEAEDLEARIFEHGGAPLAVAEGVERGEKPLERVLAEALSARQAGPLVQALLDQGLTGATGRWYRHLLAIAAGQGAFPALADLPARRLSDFARELLWVRRQLVSSNSTNERLMAERLLHGWRALCRPAAVTS